MKKHIILIMIIVLATTFVQSQQLTYSKKSTGQVKERFSQRSYGLDLIGAAKDNIYYLHIPENAMRSDIHYGANSKFRISRFNNNLQMEVKTELPLLHKRHRTNFEEVVLLNDRLWVMTSFTNTKDKKHYLLARELDLLTLEPAGGMRVIAALDFSGHTQYHRTRLTVEKSENDQKLMIFFTFVNRESSIIRYGLYVYDESFDLMWSNENVSQHFSIDGVFSHDGFAVGNDGAIYLYGKNYPSMRSYQERGLITRRLRNTRETLRPDKAGFTYVIQYFTPEDPKGSYSTFEIPDHDIRSLRLQPLQGGLINCYGIYSDKGMISAKGGFICQYNLMTGRITNYNTTTIDSRLREACFTDSELDAFRKSVGNNREWDPFDYSLSELKVRSNGTRYFVAEQILRGQHVLSEGRSTMYSTVHYNYDLFVFTMNEDFSNPKSHRIEKRQYMYPTGWINGYIVTEYNDNLNFLFNHLPRMAPQRRGQLLGETRLVMLTPSGDIQSRKVATNLTGRSLFVKPRTAHIPTDGALIYGMMGRHHNRIGFERLTIN
jgi:hypothetical protein